MSTLSTLPTRSRQHLMVTEPGVRLGVANAAVIVALLVTGALGVSDPVSVAVLVVVAAASSLRLALAWSAGIGACAWAFWTGFADHSFGRLTLDHTDLLRLGLFVACCAAVSLLTTTGRGVHQ